MKKPLPKWYLTYMGIALLGGSILGEFFVYIFRGRFTLSQLLPALTMAILLTLINLLKIRLKKDKVPETDERIKKNVLKFHFFSSHIFLGLLVAALTIISLMSIENIRVAHLWICIFAYLLISGIGALIVSRR